MGEDTVNTPGLRAPYHYHAAADLGNSSLAREHTSAESTLGAELHGALLRSPRTEQRRGFPTVLHPGRAAGGCEPQRCFPGSGERPVLLLALEVVVAPATLLLCHLRSGGCWSAQSVGCRGSPWSPVLGSLLFFLGDRLLSHRLLGVGSRRFGVRHLCS